VIGNIPHLPGKVRGEPLVLHGYPGFTADLQAITKIMVPEIVFGKDVLVFESGHNNQKQFGNLMIESTEVQHVPFLKSVAYKIGDGSHMAVISGDLHWDDNFIAFAHDADIAIIDASMPIAEFAHLKPGATPSHLSAEQCGDIAARAGIKHLVLTSLYGLDTPAQLAVEVQKHFAGKLTIPHELQVIEVV